MKINKDSQSAYGKMAVSVTGDDGKKNRFQRMEDREDRTELPVALAEHLLGAQEFTMWCGVSMYKCAYDFLMYPLLLQELRPKTIIETGSFCGASAVWMHDLAATNLGTENWGKVISSDITLENVPSELLKHPNIEFVEAANADLVDVLTPERLKSLPHPWLWIEDAHYEFEILLNKLHPYLKPGDYIICEDTNQNVHAVWQDPTWLKKHNREEQLDENIMCERKRIVLRNFCLAHPDQYRVDSHYQDMFGYNVSKTQNTIVRRVA